MPYTDKAYDAYTRQRKGARNRGIEFAFSYDDWLAWWKSHLGPHWRRKRGNKRHQYVMARRGDVGPYAVWNVECVTAAKNAADNNRNNKRAWKDGKGFTNMHHSEKTKRKMSRKHGGQNNPFWGKKHSEETRRKMSESHMRRKATGLRP